MARKGKTTTVRWRRSLAGAALLVGTTTWFCFVPHFHHLEHVKDVQVYRIGLTTRDEVRTKLGPPTMADTPRLYVYDWEKAKALGIGHFGAVPMGFTGTRALFVFDDSGRLARAEVVGAGQGSADTPEGSMGALPLAAAVPPPLKACGAGRAYGVWYAGPEPRLIVRTPDGLSLCDAAGAAVLGRLQGRYYQTGVSPEGSRFATFDNQNALMLHETATLAPLRQLAGPTHVGLSLLRWGRAISVSEGGLRVASGLGGSGIVVHDTASGAEILHLKDSWSPRLSPDGSLLVSKGPGGVCVTEVDSGCDRAFRPLPEYPFGISNNPGLSRMLLVELGATAFSADGSRMAVATCAHAEVWNLETLLSSAWEDGLEDAFLLPFSQAFGVCRATIRFATNGESLGIANEGTVTLYDLRRHTILGAYALPDLAGDAAFAPDLSRAAFVTHAGLLVWEAGKTAAPQAARGIPVPAPLPGRRITDSAEPGFR